MSKRTVIVSRNSCSTVKTPSRHSRPNCKPVAVTVMEVAGEVLVLALDADLELDARGACDMAQEALRSIAMASRTREERSDAEI